MNYEVITNSKKPKRFVSKKLIVMVATLLTLGISAGSFAQQVQQAIVPHAFKYQAVARDASGNIISGKNVSFRISILQGAANGTAVYEETQSASTNQFGLANLSIGQGTSVAGSIGDIQWGAGTYFIKIEFDPKGGSDYALMGTSQMLSVPYSLYSEHSGTADNVSQQVALIATNVAQPLDNPATGLIVYNTTTSGTAPYQVAPGLYYNAGTPQLANWVPVGDGSSAAERNHGPATSCSTNTTYGGTVQGAATANCTSAPSGTQNTGFGTDVFGTGTNPTGASNTGVGYNALNVISSGDNNTAVGTQAMLANTQGLDNTAVGFEALSTNVNTHHNTAVGYEALLDNKGGNNTAVGQEAVALNSSGSSITAQGFEALFNNTTSRSTAFGDSALVGNTSGVHNTATGFATDVKNLTGSGITVNGYEALFNNTGDANTSVGDSALVGNTSGVHNTATGFAIDVKNLTGSGITANGYEALFNNTGDANTALGDSSMYNNATGVHNTASGYAALASGTSASGSSNVANGYEALYNNTTGSFNTVAGDSAMYKNTTGLHNVAIGYTALFANSVNSANTIVGYEAAYNMNGTENTAVGDSALYGSGCTTGCNTGYYNTAIGYEAIASISTGKGNVGVGVNSLNTNSTGTGNVAVGNMALFTNATGSLNTAVGLYALQKNTAYANTAVGDSALVANSTGVFNTGEGQYAMLSNTASSSNTALGREAMKDNTTGSWNTAVGDSALFNNSAISGYENTALGYQAAAVTGISAHNSTAIGNGALFCESNEMQFGNSSVVGWAFGSAACPTTTKVFIVGSTASDGNGAYLTAGGTWTSTSDRNKKENFSEINENELLDKVLALPITRWNYKGEAAKIQHIGPMAQDFYKAFQLNNDSLGITAIDEPGVALVAIQALNKKLEAENAALKIQLGQLSTAQAQLKDEQGKRLTDDEKEIAELKGALNSIVKTSASIK